MRSLRAPALLLPLALLMACSGGRNASGNGATAPSDPRFGSASDSLFFRLERTPCLGHCPAYRIHVYASGHATYEGIGQVERLGMHQAMLDRQVLETLLREAETIGFFGLQDSYDRPVTDIPSTRLRMVSGTRDKSILARTGVPPALKAFALKADSLLLPAAWTPVPAAQ